MVRRECCRLKSWVTNLCQHSYFADHSNLEESELLQDTFRYGREEPTVEAGHEKGYSLSFTWQSTDSQYLSQPTQVSTFPYASNTTIFRKIIGFYRLLVPFPWYNTCNYPWEGAFCVPEQLKKTPCCTALLAHVHAGGLPRRLHLCPHRQHRKIHWFVCSRDVMFEFPQSTLVEAVRHIFHALNTYEWYRDKNSECNYRSVCRMKHGWMKKNASCPFTKFQAAGITAQGKTISGRWLSAWF